MTTVQEASLISKSESRKRPNPTQSRAHGNARTGEIRRDEDDRAMQVADRDDRLRDRPVFGLGPMQVSPVNSEKRLRARKCALCHEDRDLLDSHYLPAALYKNLIRSSPGHNPVVVSKEIAIETSKQASDYLLCAECEDRFNKRGEMWVLPRSWQSDGSFPLRDLLKNAPDGHAGGGMVIHSAIGIPDIDRDKLVYFGASIFWRATQTWQRVPEAHRLKLGPYEEELRLFLLDKAPFPEHCSICVGVNRNEELQLAATAIFPYLKNKDQNCKQYNFAMMGMVFDLFVGRGMDTVRREMCLLRGQQNPIFLADAAGVAILDSFGRLMRTSRAVGRLAK
jgi:hypothetical protein